MKFNGKILRKEVNDMIKIIVDAFGGDKSPIVNIEGAIQALNALSDLTIILVGDETILKKELDTRTYDANRLSILDAKDVITCDDKPTEAIKHKKESSLVKAFELLKNDEEIGAMVSIGSTGALLAGTVLKIGRIKGVKRPAFCPLLPTMKKGFVAICDSGANVDCDPIHLQQFAIMGSLYLEKAYNISAPKAALLNIGTEEEKGDQLHKEAYQLLNNTNTINFVGNMESRDLLSGKYDLVICDGFSGNVLLKSTEGACLELLKLLKQTFKKNVKTKMGALLLKKDIMAIKDFMDYNNYGGAVVLGAKKTIVKGHGSSNSTAIYQCIKQAYMMEKNKLCEVIGNAIFELTNQDD